MTNYSRGADFERAVVKHLEQQGYLAFRCAGSKGAKKVDVVCIVPNKKTHLIQCKLSGIVSKFEKEQLKIAAKGFGCLPVLASKENGKIRFEMIE